MRQVQSEVTLQVVSLWQDCVLVELRLVSKKLFPEVIICMNFFQTEIASVEGFVLGQIYLLTDQVSFELAKQQSIILEECRQTMSERKQTCRQIRTKLIVDNQVIIRSSRSRKNQIEEMWKDCISRIKLPRQYKPARSCQVSIFRKQQVKSKPT